MPEAPTLVEKMNEFRKQISFDHVIFTKDWHPSNHCSFASNHPGKNPFDKYMVWNYVSFSEFSTDAVMESLGIKKKRCGPYIVFKRHTVPRFIRTWFGKRGVCRLLLFDMAVSLFILGGTVT